MQELCGSRRCERLRNIPAKQKKKMEIHMAEKRCATVKRTTGETDITITIDLDGTGKAKVDTGIGSC